MAYQIDFSAANYRRRWVGLACVIVAVFGALGSAIWGGYEVYRIWNLPTLQQQLGAYQMLADRVDASYRHLREVSERYESMSPYLRLYWAESAEDVLSLLSENVDRHPDAVRPLRWQIETGAHVTMEYVFQVAGFRRQAQVESVRAAMLSLLDQEDESGALQQPEDLRVTIPEQDLARVSDIPLTMQFSLDPVPYQQLPGAGAALSRVIETLQNRRQAVHEVTLGKEGSPTARIVRAAMAEVVQAAFRDHPDHEIWRARSQSIISPSVFFQEVERSLREEGRSIPAILSEVKQQWEAIADRRWPWRRHRDLDDGTLTQEIAKLQSIVEAGMPSPSVFAELDSRLKHIEGTLSGGYSIARIFHEGDLHQEIDVVLSRHWDGSSAFDVERGTLRNGLMLAPWSVRLEREGASGARSGRSTSKPLGLKHAVALTEALRSLQVGLVVDTIETQFQACDEYGAFGLQFVKLQGKLPVREQMELVVSGDNISR